jgi:non-structural maintenance of chromosomes element 1
MVSSNDVQRLFLQAVASRRVLSQKLAAKLWQKCVEAVKGQSYVLHASMALTSHSAVDETLEIEYSDNVVDWNNWVTKMNSALNPLDLEFVHVFDEATGKDMYALVHVFALWKDSKLT